MREGAVGLDSLADDKNVTRFDSYIDKDGGEHKSISDNPFITLSDDNSNQIRTIRNALKENNIPFTDFANTMIVGTYADKNSDLERLLNLSSNQLQHNHHDNGNEFYRLFKMHVKNSLSGKFSHESGHQRAMLLLRDLTEKYMMSGSLFQKLDLMMLRRQTII